MAAAGNAQPAQALRIAGAAAASFEALGVDASAIAFWNALLYRYLGRARAVVVPDAAAAAWEEGHGTSFEFAVALALSPPEPVTETLCAPGTVPLGMRAIIRKSSAMPSPRRSQTR